MEQDEEIQGTVRDLEEICNQIEFKLLQGIVRYMIYVGRVLIIFFFF